MDTKSENPYENPMKYNHDKLSPTFSPVKNKAQAPELPKRSWGNIFDDSQWRKQKLIFAGAAIVILVFMMCLEIAELAKVLEHSSAGTAGDASTSCLQIQQSGVTKSGYYFLRNEETEETYRTFCEMESADGGWTLVATIHENDITRKCTLNDLWFSNNVFSLNEPYLTRLWENKNVAGQLERATSGDYKNQGYHSLQASNVLVQHIRNNRPILNGRSEIFLEYHSTNNFLQSHGGNLYNVYREYYSLNPSEAAETVPNQNEVVLNALQTNANDIISGIPDFYRYDYGNDRDELRDGGLNMFSPSGMLIYYYFSCRYTIEYGRSYSCPSSYSTVSSRKIHPFFALLSVGNYDRSRHNFYIHVTSFRNSTADSVAQYSGRLLQGDYELQYNAYCRYGGPIPSLCEITYVVNSTKNWKSSTTFIFASLVQTLSTTQQYRNQQNINEYPMNIAFGYTMFSRTSGRLVSQNQAESALKRMLAIFATFPNMFSPTCQDAERNLVVPVTYTIGGNTLPNRIPPSLSGQATTGFMQFRAKSVSGIFYAFCPAVKVETCLSQHLCVGGVRTDGNGAPDDCSDFLAQENTGSCVNAINSSYIILNCRQPDCFEISPLISAVGDLLCFSKKRNTSGRIFGIGTMEEV